MKKKSFAQCTQCVCKVEYGVKTLFVACFVVFSSTLYPPV